MAVRDGLKPLDKLLQPDERHASFVRVHPETRQPIPITREDHYADIEQFNLHETVPEAIATQYDVARNIYVYAWLEYRFFNVAEAQVLTVLELAMKRRIGAGNIEEYIKKRKQAYKVETGKKLHLSNGMKTLMEYCRDKQLIANEGFSAWRNYASQQAYYKTWQKQSDWATAEMQRTGSNEIELEDIQFEALPPDPDYDHVQHLINHVNQVRNNYAHGSTGLNPNILYSFQMVSEFINQLFPLNDI